MALRAARQLVACALALVAVLVATPARAEPKMPIVILAIDSDDAEEQADGLTGALRSKARSSSHFNLVDTSQSLGMLTAALKCPPKPDPTCLDRIAATI